MDNYCVYRHTAPNGKMYVGITKQNPTARWANGNGYSRQPYFFNAIKKYGWNNFKHDILLKDLTIEQASWVEKVLIEYWALNNREYGYNYESGGTKGYYISEETRHKKSEIMRGKHSGKNNPMYGKHLTEEQKHKISVANSGRVRSAEMRKKMSKNRPKKMVVQINKDTLDVIACFESTHEAHRRTGVGQANISKCCLHQNKTAGGYKWEYYDEYIKERREIC